MNHLFTEIIEKLKDKNKKIVLPEATDCRVLEAAARLHIEGHVEVILLGNESEVNSVATDAGIDIAGITIIDPLTAVDKEVLAQSLFERRRGKMTMEQARTQVKDVNYFGTMLVYTGRADGLVSGAVHSTADTVRPALQIIKTKPGISRTSGAFIMMKGDEKLIFADCAINVSPSSQDLAEIAMESAKTAQSFGIEPRVAMLSFSTKGSAITKETQKVADAVAIVQAQMPELPLDGEFQFDAAYVPAIAAKKAPDSIIKGDANVFVFPSLEAGNIGYKMTERLGGYEAIGPILQGLNSAVNDLSRGCSADDVYKLTLITAAQCL